jgi:hypothetical protein
MSGRGRTNRAGTGIMVIRTILGNITIETSGVTTPTASVDAEVVTKGYVDGQTVSINNPTAIFSGNIGQTTITLTFTKVHDKLVTMVIPGLSANQTTSHVCHAPDGTIPADYRPSTDSVVAGITLVSDDSVAKTANITVTADGSITISNVTGDDWSGSGTFTVTACTVFWVV